jgi:hypothetical protein
MSSYDTCLIDIVICLSPSQSAHTDTMQKTALCHLILFHRVLFCLFDTILTKPSVLLHTFNTSSLVLYVIVFTCASMAINISLFSSTENPSFQYIHMICTDNCNGELDKSIYVPLNKGGARTRISIVLGCTK